MQEASLSRIWLAIVAELSFHQDSAPQEHAGQVVNPICKNVYTLDTACAAKAFAVEYKRTQDLSFHQRAIAALESISFSKLATGLPEPIWDVLGWHESTPSLAATGMAFDALFDAERVLGNPVVEKDYFESLLLFLEHCYHGKGSFAHNVIDANESPGDVQNTTAVALYLLEYLSRELPGSSHPLLSQRQKAIHHLYDGQRKDGYWPYLHPSLNYKKKLLCLYPPLMRSWIVASNFGDIFHQAMTLYFVTRYFSLSQTSLYFDVVPRGWSWLKRRLVNHNDELVIDWNWEPVPTAPRYCNFRDTNAYFWIIALLSYLVKLDVATKDESEIIVSGILRHISSKLMNTDGEFPCIAPHEGPPEILRNIFPMFDQGIAWKGAFLADSIWHSLTAEE